MTDTKRIVFLAHPVGAKTPEGHRQNLLRAKRWARWVLKQYPGTIVMAAYLYYCEILDDADPAQRELGQAHGHSILELCCDELWLVGGSISSGMALERDLALEWQIPIRDFTALGAEPPDVAPALEDVPSIDHRDRFTITDIG